ncbi:MAG: hypothetical protein ACFFCS_15405 [Candidatus Hodarchaeota archaeon]
MKKQAILAMGIAFLALGVLFFMLFYLQVGRCAAETGSDPNDCGWGGLPWLIPGIFLIIFAFIALILGARDKYNFALRKVEKYERRIADLEARGKKVNPWDLRELEKYRQQLKRLKQNLADRGIKVDEYESCTFCGATVTGRICPGCNAKWCANCGTWNEPGLKRCAKCQYTLPWF